MNKKLFSEIDWFMLIWLAVLLFITAWMFQSCATLDIKDEVVRDKVYTLEELQTYSNNDVSHEITIKDLPDDFVDLDMTNVYVTTYLPFEREDCNEFIWRLYLSNNTYITINRGDDVIMVFYKDDGR